MYFVIWIIINLTMKTMKKILLLFALFLVFNSNSKSQNAVISGYLNDSLGGVNNVYLYWTILGTLDSGYVTTNSNGYFSDTIQTSAVFDSISFRYINCFSNTVSKILPFDAAPVNSILYNLDYCYSNTITNPSPSCNISFTYVADADTFYFTPSIIDSTVNYSWDFNYNQGSSNDATPSFIYPNSGSFLACVSITDQNGCSDYFCDSVFNYTNPNPVCNIYYTYYSIGDTYHFQPSIIDSSYSYVWNLNGNQPISFDAEPIYIDTLLNGNFQICVEVVNQNNCTAYFCDTIIPNSNVFNSSMNGTVIKSAVAAEDAVVYLIQSNLTPNGTVLSVVDSTLTDQYGTFHFYNLNLNSTYYVKAALLPSSADFSDYLPTYYADTAVFSAGQAVFWSQAEPLIYNFNTNPTGFPILIVQLTQGTNSGGPGFVSGLVSQGAGIGQLSNFNNARSVLKDIQIVLRDENNVPVAFALSDNDGRFEITNLAYGNYILSCEIPGIPSQVLNLTLSESKEGFDNIEVTINSDEIEIDLNTTNTDLLVENNFKIYPNPVVNHIRIINEDVNLSEFNYEVFNFNGQLVLFNVLPSNGIISFDYLDKGTYFIRLSSANSQFQFKVVK